MQRVTVIGLVLLLALGGCVSTRTYYEPLDCSNNATSCPEGNQYTERTALTWRMPTSEEWMQILHLTLDAGNTALQYSASKPSSGSSSGSTAAPTTSVKPQPWQTGGWNWRGRQE
jgi:hypothetical protein